jgi:holo-[acyl-carrier protein] synthase
MPERLVTGVDLQPIDEVQGTLSRFGTRYRHRVFTDQELKACGDGPLATSRLAARFAAKEAVLKILKPQEVVPPWRSIEIQGASSQQASVLLHGSAADLARRQGVSDISVSFGHAGDVAVAAVSATVSMSGSRGIGQ